MVSSIATVRALLVGLLLGLTGCPLSLYQANRLPESRPLAEPVLFNHPGPLLHEPTKLLFEEEYQRFERVTAYRYDTTGQSVSFGYNDRRADCLIVATIYIYPTPRMVFVGASPNAVEVTEQKTLEQGFAESKAEVDHYHPGLQSPLVGASTTLAAGSELHGTSMIFRDSDSVSELRLFVYRHQWFLKYRFTYPEACRADASARIDALVASLPWAVAR